MWSTFEQYAFHYWRMTLIVKRSRRFFKSKMRVKQTEERKSWRPKCRVLTKVPWGMTWANINLQSLHGTRQKGHGCKCYQSVISKSPLQVKQVSLSAAHGYSDWLGNTMLLVSVSGNMRAIYVCTCRMASNQCLGAARSCYRRENCTSTKYRKWELQVLADISSREAWCSKEVSLRNVSDS